MGIFYLMNMPESPKFLVAKGRFQEARDAFKLIGLRNGLDEKTIEKRLFEIKFIGEHSNN
jgi:hypothetical protein